MNAHTYKSSIPLTISPPFAFSVGQRPPSPPQCRPRVISRFRRDGATNTDFSSDFAFEIELLVQVPDDASSSCLVCSVPFSIFNRRHHCRSRFLLLLFACRSDAFDASTASAVSSSNSCRVCGLLLCDACCIKRVVSALRIIVFPALVHVILLFLSFLNKCVSPVPSPPLWSAAVTPASTQSDQE